MSSTATVMLIDGDQQVSAALPAVLERLTATSNIVERRVYGAGLAPWKAYFDRLAFVISPLPPPVDSALMVDAIDLVHTRPEIRHFCIATADRDFTPLVAKLKERGKRVTCIAQGPMSAKLREICDEFLSLDILPKAGLAEAAVPDIVAAMRELTWPEGRVDHNWLTTRLKSKGFDARAFGHSSLIDLVDALPAVFQVEPTPRVGGAVTVRTKPDAARPPLTHPE